MVIVNLFDLVAICITVLIIVILGVLALVNRIINKFKKNCFECKYYKLDNVASFGDKCWYKCNKKEIINGHSMNDREFFVKCDEFEKKEV